MLFSLKPKIKKNILIFSYKEMIGGSELNALKLSRFIKHNFFWLTVEKHRNIFFRNFKTILRFYSLKKNNPINFILNLFFIFTIVKKHKINTIYAIGFLPSLYSSIIKIFLKINLVTTKRGKGNEVKKKFFIFSQIINILSDTIETNSYTIFKQIKKSFFVKKKIVLVENIIPQYIYKTQNKKKNTNITIGILSNLRPIKNPNLIKNLIEKICLPTNKVNFKIIGRDYLKTYSYVSNKFKNKINWKKHINNEKINSFYQSIDILLITSLYESSPNVIYEAFSNGVPVVSTPNEGSKFLIRQYYNGYISKDFNSRSLIKGINKVKSNLDYFSQNAKKTFDKNYSFEKNIKKITKYL